MNDTLKNLRFKIKIDTSPLLFQIESFLPGVIININLMDSVFDYFPNMDILLKDGGTFFSEKHFYSEFIDFILELEDSNNEKIKHVFYLDQYKLPEVHSPDILSGLNLFSLNSNFLKQDSIKSKSYRNNLSEIVRQIISNYKFPKEYPDYKITNTNSFNVWYQSNEYDFQFLKKVVRYAHSPIDSYSPFISFIDLTGKFYFVTVAELFNQNPVENLYYGSLEVDEVSKKVRNDIILGINFDTLGSKVNSLNYNKLLSKINQRGEYVIENKKLEDIYNTRNRIGFNKLTIMKQFQNKERDYNEFGIEDDVIQRNLYLGWRNSLFIDTLFMYRLSIRLNLNLRLVSGKMVKLNIPSRDSERNNISGEYSGNWLILESIHTIDRNGIGTTTLLLGKSSVNVSRNHLLYKDFI